MGPSGIEHVEAFREAFRDARADTTRHVAARLGTAIAKVAWDTRDDAKVRTALAAVRSTGLRFLEELTRDNDLANARQLAFQAVDGLELTLRTAHEGELPAKETQRKAPAKRRGLFGGKSLRAGLAAQNEPAPARARLAS